jgi:hypothetical protein
MDARLMPSTFSRSQKQEQKETKNTATAWAGWDQRQEGMLILCFRKVSFGMKKRRICGTSSSPGPLAGNRRYTEIPDNQMTRYTDNKTKA